MYRSFEAQSRRMLGEGEGAYSRESVTEPSTPQMTALWSNPSGSGSFAASRRCALGHRGATDYAPSAAPRSAAKLLAAIGAATSSEAP
jgi:hypothetical protein